MYMYMYNRQRALPVGEAVERRFDDAPQARWVLILDFMLFALEQIPVFWTKNILPCWRQYVKGAGYSGVSGPAC
jgi:hypothetical protein